MPNLRKVSVSPWCDQAAMAERLAGGDVVYSRHLSPNYLGVAPEFDPDADAAHGQETVTATRGRCRVEFVIQDVQDLHGNPAKAREAVGIIRRLSEDLY
jgi:acetylornithine deacetylase/succinyl-diaminopimelate desuccinylase-like protein